jgi:4-hydroxy-4-methyl-2-oxoglutarate aldolase
VSHAYAHLFDFGANLNIGGLEVHPGDLLHGDRHGLLTIPGEIAGEIPAVAERQQQAEQKVISLCQSKQFSVEKLRQALKDLG